MQTFIGETIVLYIPCLCCILYSIFLFRRPRGRSSNHATLVVLLWSDVDVIMGYVHDVKFLMAGVRFSQSWKVVSRAANLAK